jgi:hypothetical protein
MPKFELLLLDAGVVIGLHELGLWREIVDRCHVTITQTIVDETQYQLSTDPAEIQERLIPDAIDLQAEIQRGKIQCKDVPLDKIRQFKKIFDPSYFDRLDPGEVESLALLFESEQKWLICSADAIVFKVLGRLGRSQQGISLEEILQQTGLAKKIGWKFSKQFREKYTWQGEKDSITGTGLREDHPA